MLDLPLWRSPAARLLLGGAVLVALLRAVGTPRSPHDAATTTIHVGPPQIDGARRTFLAQTGRAPDENELARLVDAEIDDEILYREALAHGLDRHDPVVQHRLRSNLSFVEDEPPPPAVPEGSLARDMLQQDLVVRRRLIARMRALLEEDALRSAPSDAELEQVVTRHPERFALPPRVSLAYVALPDGAPASGAERGRTALDELRRSGLAPRDVAGRADLGLAPPVELPPQSERDLERALGAPFARAAFAAAPGAWTEPIASPGAVHVLWVHEHTPARAAEPSTVRNQARALLLRERADAAVRRALDDLRRGYSVSVAATPAGEG